MPYYGQNIILVDHWPSSGEYKQCAAVAISLLESLLMNDAEQLYRFPPCEYVSFPVAGDLYPETNPYVDSRFCDGIIGGIGSKSDDSLFSAAFCKLSTVGIPSDTENSGAGLAIASSILSWVQKSIVSIESLLEETLATESSSYCIPTSESATAVDGSSDIDTTAATENAARNK